jgi:hypothetical protein
VPALLNRSTQLPKACRDLNETISEKSSDEWFGRHRDKVRLLPDKARLVAIDRARIWRQTVTKKLTSVLFVLVGVFMGEISAAAHHGNAGYDYTKTIVIKGTVTEWVWSNPHCLLKFDAKDEKGNLQHWVTEGSSPVDMLHIGWGKNTFKAGDAITVDVMPNKDDNTPVGRIRKVTLSDGTVLQATTRTVI